MGEDTELTRWVVHGERLVYDNRWIRLGLADVEIPGGERFEHHVVHLDRAAIAVVLDEQDRVLLMWRHRFVFDRWGWELPGGLVEASEDPMATAVREVEEETVSLLRFDGHRRCVGQAAAAASKSAGLR